MSGTSLFEVYLAIFTQFFFVHPINLNELVVFYIFQWLTNIFKNDFTKFQDKKHFFFKFQEFSWTNVKVKDFSRSVRTLYMDRLMMDSVFLPHFHVFCQNIKSP